MPESLAIVPEKWYSVHCHDTTVYGWWIQRMADEYYIVKREALPTVFLKVIEAKRLLGTGAAHSTAEAVRMTGISRGAFYKYKDMIAPYENDASSRVLTVQSVLEDRPGVLSSLLAAFSGAGANILTVNQSIPSDGAAYVTVSARTDTMSVTAGELLELLRALDGVVSIAGLGLK